MVSPRILTRIRHCPGLSLRRRPAAAAGLIERNLRSYGLEERAARLKPALGLIENGAEVIVAACGNYTAFPHAGYTRISGTDVPIVDAFLAGA
jgi:hypothetical protein